MKIADLKVGQVLYDVHSERAGNTTMRRAESKQAGAGMQQKR
jgi:hypothetical protein